ncbi:MAG: hypothetical protein COC12_03545 [Rhodobacteraceae bacterium]|nr:MAG: hypothetical protein COC12_03545 [Paracoccaceae bacterium]
MTDASTSASQKPKWLLVLAAIAIVFGAMTVFSGGRVLFGPREAQAAAGNYVPYVVWFNFLAGFAYILAGIGIWFRTKCAKRLAMGILGATVAIGVVFGVHVASGGAYEMRTVGALIFRAAVWAGIVVALRRTAA